MRRRSCLAVVCALTMFAACSSSSDSGSGGRIQSLLAQVPAEGAFRDQVTVIDLTKARDLAGITQPAHDADFGDYVKLFVAKGAAVEALSPGIFGSRSAPIDEWRSRTGFSLLDANASIDAGEPPHVISVLEARIDESQVSAALAADFGSATTQRDSHGEHIVSIGADDEVDLKSTSVVRPLGESVRVAIDNDRIRWARSDADLDAALDAAHGGRSLADDDQFRTAAAALDKAGAYQAIFTAKPDRFKIDAALENSRMSPSQIAAARKELQATALEPWQVAAFGDAVIDDRPAGVVVLVHADADAAKANTDRLRSALTSGNDPQSGRPYSEQVSSVDVRSNGNIVIATMRLERPGYLFRLLVQGGLPLSIG